jgi:heptosyltransferase-3
MLARNVLIFHTGALGDFVLSWPLGLALGRLFPQSRVFYVAQKQKGALAEVALRLESLDLESGWHALFGDAATLAEANRKKLESSHYIATYLAKAGDAWMKNVAAIAPKAHVIGIDPRVPENYSQHFSHHLLHELASEPMLQTGVKQILASIQTQGVGRGIGASAGPVVIHPGSGSPDKCWPLAKFLELIEQLRARGKRCVALLGEVELERWSSAEIDQLEAAVKVHRPGNYVELFKELSAASAFVGNDSGPSHLAAIVGLPTTVLFGPTNPAVWKPLGPRVAALQHATLADLPVSDVCDAALSQALPAPASS